MRILIILPSFPYPPNNGYRIKTFNLIEILNKHFEVEVLMLQLKNGSFDQSYFKDNNITCHFEYIGLIEKSWNLLQAVFSKAPFQSAVYNSKKVRRILRNDQGYYDYFVCSMIRTSGYLDLLPKSKVIFDMIDLLSKSYSKSKDNTNSILHKLVYKLEVDRLERREKYVAMNASRVLLVNKEEKELLNRYEDNVEWIPNGVNKLLFNYRLFDKAYNNDIVFFGTMNYQPNIDAIIWLDKYVLDHIDPKIRIIIVGSNPVGTIISIQKRRKNIVLTGYLDDPYIILNSCLAVIAPMQNGGGIQNKLLESMALGTINIVSSYAAQPIVGAEDGKHFLVKDDPLEYANMINNIYANPAKYEFLKEQSRAFIMSDYTWEKYEDTLMPLFK